MAKKLLLAQLPKRTRERVTRIMEQGDGDLALVDFLAKRWDYGNYLRRPGSSDELNASLMASMREGAERLYPDVADDVIDRLMPFYNLRFDLKEAAMARRIALEDPGELARGLAVDGRLYKILRAYKHGYDDILCDLCAVRQVDFAVECVAGLRAGHDAIISVGESFGIGMMAILQQNEQALAVVTSRPPDHEDLKWIEGLYGCLVGVARHQPTSVAEGLSEHLAGVKNTRHTDWPGANGLAAHGFYRLCEWVSPELVSEFDVDQPRPWDAEFHQWCEDHPDPLADIDLSSISQELHDAVILDHWPVWLPREPAERWQIVLTDLGEPVESNRDIAAFRKQLIGMLENGPVVTHWNLTRDNAEHRANQMARAGGRTDIRPNEGTDYRLFSEKQGKVTEWKPTP